MDVRVKENNKKNENGKGHEEWNQEEERGEQITTSKTSTA